VVFITCIDRIKYKHYKEILIMSKYYSINEFSKILGVSAQTLRNWDANGKLHPHHTSGNGYRMHKVNVQIKLES
jgi:excisionase family DNA binding protein